MSAPEPEDRRSRRDLLAALGVLLVLSGVAVIVLAAITTLLVAPPGVFLVVSGIGLVVTSEYRDEADLDYSRWGGLKVKVRRNAGAAEGRPAKPVRSRPPARRSSHAGKANSGRFRRRTRQGPNGGCRLARALNGRWGRKQ